MKRPQTESDQLLVNLERVIRGDRYPGVVVLTKETAAIVVFYNNVNRWINTKRIIGDGKINAVDVRPYYI